MISQMHAIKHCVSTAATWRIHCNQLFVVQSVSNSCIFCLDAARYSQVSLDGHLIRRILTWQMWSSKCWKFRFRWWFSAKFRRFNLKQISYVGSCFFKCFNPLKCRTSTSRDRKFSSGNTESFACLDLFDLFGRAALVCICRHMIWTSHSCIRLWGLKVRSAFLYGSVPWDILQRSPTQSGSFCGSVSRPDFSGKGIQCSANLCNLHSAAWEKISIFW